MTNSDFSHPVGFIIPVSACFLVYGKSSRVSVDGGECRKCGVKYIHRPERRDMEEFIVLGNQL